MQSPRPISEADLQRVEAVFTDVDGTLTSHDRLASGTIAAIERLDAAGVKVVLVTGRSAGWGECWARTLPVHGVIVENGGMYFAREGARTVKRYVQSAAERDRNRLKLRNDVQAAMAAVEGARLSSDSAWREIDLAIDYNEEVRLGGEAAGRLEAFLHVRDVQAVRSSVHVNCWIGGFDKATTVRQFLRDEWNVEPREGDDRFVYAGDSFNDAPLFAAFPLSVGVANVVDVLDRIDSPPKFVTPSREGAGFRELAEAILARRG